MINYQVHIKTLRIENFRRFESLNIDFDGSNIAILAGRNATGKTTILEAINLALSERNSKFTEVKESDFYSEEPIIFEVTFDKPYFYQFQDEQTSYQGLIPCYGFKKEIKRRNRKERGKFFSSEYDINIDPVIQSFDPSNEEFEEIKKAEMHIDAGVHIVRKFLVSEEGYKYSIRSYPNDYRELQPNDVEFKYGGTKILFPQSFYFDNNRDRELLSQYNTAFSNMITELNWRYKRELFRDTNVEKKDKLFDIYEKFHEGLNKFDNHEKTLVIPAIEMVRDNFGIELGESLKMLALNIYQPYTNALFGKITEQNQLIPATDYGSGITMLLAISLSISFAEESKVPIIILIDEPELHLHADLQKKLFLFLKNAKSQAILSTHSHLLIDKTDFSNNHILEEINDCVVEKKADQLDVSDLQFRLLGNSLDDLYIPERIILVEGIHDSRLLKKCLLLLRYKNLEVQFVEVGGKDNIPDKAEKYDQLITKILSPDKWYSTAIKKDLRIIVDGDVPSTKVAGWVSAYSLDQDKQIKHLNPAEKLCMEHYLPASEVLRCVEKTKLRDESMLKDKSFKQIIDIILKDDKIPRSEKEARCEQVENRVSKARLNQEVVNALTLDILNANESTSLKQVIEWVANYDRC